MIKKLDGNNSFLGIALLAVYNLLVQWKPEVAELVSPEVVNTILGAYTAWAFRRAIKKAE